MVTEISNKVDRRAAILQAAREVLAAKGLEAAKVSDIVARAGVAQGTFYLYFSSKMELIVALTEEMNAETMRVLENEVAQASSFSEMIPRCIRASFEVMGSYRDILALIHSRIALAALTSEECLELDKPMYGYVSELIRMGQAAGEISPLVNPEISSRLILGLMEHACHEFYIFQTQMPTETYIQEVIRFVKGALGARE